MTSPPPAPTSATPRPLTAAAARQSWRELPVRTWAALTVGLILVILAVGVRGLITGRADRQLLAQGLRLDGKIDVIAGARTNASRSVQREITLSFQMPEETQRRVLEKQILESEANAPPISWGDKLPILVDRKDPRKWTSRLQPASWIVVMAVPLLLAPLAIIFALITRAMRRRLLHLHASGTLRSAKVSEAHRSPLIPGQKVAKFTVGGKTLAAAYPDALGRIDVGDAIDVILDNDAKPSRAIVALAYDTVPPPVKWRGKAIVFLVVLIVVFTKLAAMAREATSGQVALVFSILMVATAIALVGIIVDWIVRSRAR